jgi:hypothetical protein
MARAMLACGFEVGFRRIPVVWNWLPRESVVSCHEQGVPASAGTALAV